MTKVTELILLMFTCLPSIISETCTFTRYNDFTGREDGSFKTPANIGTCENMCIADDACIAVFISGTLCFFADSLEKKAKEGATFSVKSCGSAETTTPEPTTDEPTTPEPTTPEPTTPEPTTPEPTTPEPTSPEPTTPEPTTPEPTSPEPTTPEPTTPEPTTPEPTTPESTTPEPTTPEPTTPEPTSPELTSPEPTTPEPTTPERTTEKIHQGICIMQRVENKTTESEAYFKLKLSEGTCLSFCQHVDDCKSVTIDSTSCKFYTDVTTTSTFYGSRHYVRTRCQNGFNCCWKNQSSASGTKTPAFKLENTLESCEAICGTMLRCSGITWSNNECSIYVRGVDLTSKCDSTYSKKTCTTGGDVGSFKFESVCTERDGSFQFKVNMLLFLSLLLFVFYL